MSGKKIANILLGVTGSIAVYKAADLVRQLIKAGFDVKVVMTESAKQFVHPNTFATLSRHPVYDDLFAKDHDLMVHIELAKWADIILIAPASAATISRIANGMSNDLLSTICTASTATLMMAPAMNQAMWANFAVQLNVKKLLENQVIILNPDAGEQACGDVGVGRLLDNAEILDAIMQQSNVKKKFLNKRILITAGPTQEAIDPIRYISNHSSGKMGYALASAAKMLGAEVTLISGPTFITPPIVNNFIAVNSAAEMHEAVMKAIDHTDIFISAAAVADYRPKQKASQKIKKSAEALTVELEKTQDILSVVTAKKTKPMVIGFAAETENALKNALKKLADKNLDAIILNEVTQSGYPFYADSNEVTFIDKNQQTKLAKTDKQTLAFQLLDLIHDL